MCRRACLVADGVLMVLTAVPVQWSAVVLCVDNGHLHSENMLGHFAYTIRTYM